MLQLALRGLPNQARLLLFVALQGLYLLEVERNWRDLPYLRIYLLVLTLFNVLALVTPRAIRPLCKVTLRVIAPLGVFFEFLEVAGQILQYLALALLQRRIRIYRVKVLL